MEPTGKAVYEPPQLVEIGTFAELTHGDGPAGSDFVYAKRGYWLI